jgi:hypothetical protein
MMVLILRPIYLGMIINDLNRFGLNNDSAFRSSSFSLQPLDNTDTYTYILLVNALDGRKVWCQYYWSIWSPSARRKVVSLLIICISNRFRPKLQTPDNWIPLYIQWIHRAGSRTDPKGAPPTTPFYPDPGVTVSIQTGGKRSTQNWGRHGQFVTRADPARSACSGHTVLGRGRTPRAPRRLPPPSRSQLRCVDSDRGGEIHAKLGMPRAVRDTHRPSPQRLSNTSVHPKI